MRRSLAGLSVVAMLLIPMQVLAVVSVSGTYKDTFSSGGYSGSDGTLVWEIPWKEIGESDGPGNGVVRVDKDDYCPDGTCLYIAGDSEYFDKIGAVRYADLSMFASAELSYDVRRDSDEAEKGEANAQLLVQVSADGASWTTMKNLGLETTDGSPIHESHGITKWIAESFAVRYIVTGTLDGSVYIDNVELKGELPKPTTTTTTTTTKPTTTTTERPTTTTTEREPTTTTLSTTTTPTSTNTDEGDGAAGVIPSDGPPPGTGIRESATGIQADYDRSLFGTMEMEKPQVLGIELSADYLIAVEVIEASWTWMLGLGLIIAWAIVSNVERKRPGPLA